MAARAGGSEPRKHHYVPQFLLRNFANERNLLRTLDLETKRVYVQPLANAAAKRDYYAIHDSNGQREQTVERYLAKMEHHLAGGVRRLVDGEFTAPVKAPASIRQLIASFVLVQWARTPAGHQRLSDVADAQLKKQIREAGATHLREMFDAVRETPLTDKEAEEYWNILSNESYYRFTDYNANLVHAGFGDWTERQKQLAEHAMLLIEWHRKTILIGDQPVLTIPHGGFESAEFESVQKIGRVDPLEAELILVPISRRKALIIFPEEGTKYIHSKLGNAFLANFINELSILAADRHIFGHPDDDLFGKTEDRVRLHKHLVFPLEQMRQLL